ncbi:YcnI family protein [Williamsia muralis]|uniref:YcnI family protein n=2 Tax=Williamsia marianensis TaxID=85044 RepID=A0ABU4ESA7_WILMA|nr:YcnI family protein [Williamsia muralis]MDV7133626.1 YcnI family protein [Williamsia muralis]
MVGGLSLLGAGSASAHVTAAGDGLTQGGYGVITFRVPNESDTASTVALTVALPNLTSARTEPLPGWTAEVKKDPATEAATEVTWKVADGNPGIRPGEFLQFRVSGGPLPEQETVTMAATQTYSDGEVVRWDQPTVEGQPEPDKPAPTVTLGAPTADGHGDSATHEEDTQTASENSASSDADSTDDTARWLAGAGILLGALGIGVAIGALARKRQ